MAANPPPTVYVVRIMGGGNPQVFPLLSTQILDTQVGADIGTGGPGVPPQENYSNTIYYGPRWIEFRGDEYVVLGNSINGDWGVYKRNQGGADQWGRVCGGSGQSLLSDTFVSALHVAHPNGVPTLIFLAAHAGGLHLYSTTDGITGSDWGTNSSSTVLNSAAGFGVEAWGPSALWRESIAFIYRDTSGTSTAIIYDLRLAVSTIVSLTTFFSNQASSRGTIHIHEDTLFVLAPATVTGYPALVKIAGGTATAVAVFTPVPTVPVRPLALQARMCMFTDPGTGDLIFFLNTDQQTHCFAVADASTSPVLTDVSDAVFGTASADPLSPGKYRTGGIAFSTTRSYRVMVDTSTDPANPRTYIYTFVAGGQYECWEWKGYGDGTTLDSSEIEIVANGAGISSAIYAIPNNSIGGGQQFPSSARVELGDAYHGFQTVIGGTKFYFRGYGSAAAGTVTFRGNDQGQLSNPPTVVPIVAASLVVENALQDGLEAYYKFNGDGTDSSVNGRDLTLTGAVPFVAGLIGNAADFPGTNGNYWSLASNPVFDLGAGFAPFAVSAWVNADSVTDAVILGHGGSDGWAFYVLSTGAVRFHQQGLGAPGQHPTGTGLISIGAGWQHILATSDGSTIKIYVDGVEELSEPVAVATTPSTGDFVVGNNAANIYPFNGQVDEVAVWTRALIPEEVVSLYNAGSGHELGTTLTPTTTPSISGNTITNLTPDDGLSLYSVILDVDAPGVDVTEGEYGIIVPDFA